MSLKELIKSFSDERWNIGFIRNSLDGIIAGEALRVEWVKHKCKNSWFADPFILEVTADEILVLVEEYYKPIKRGRISRLIVDRHSCELKQRDVVLELPTHLSFPAILRDNGKIFIYPESGENGTLDLYEYDPESNHCYKVDTILNKPVADAVIVNISGNEYLFCTEQPNPNGNVLDIYKRANGIFAPFEKSVFEENVARMAGDFFEFQGKLYRPTQECNVQYGHAVTLQEVWQEQGHFKFRERCRLYSSHPILNVGMHTFNIYKDVIVTDALGFKNVWIRKVLKTLGLK